MNFSPFKWGIKGKFKLKKTYFKEDLIFQLYIFILGLY